MSDTANTKPENGRKRKKRSWPVRIVRAIAFVGLGFFLLIVALVAFSETSLFRSTMRDYIMEAADSSLNARLTIESIDGNLFSGWKLKDVRLRDANGPIAEFESIILRYNLFRIPWKVVTIRELTLNAPRIHVTRAAGRDWNINTMLRPSEDEDTTSAPLAWDIRVENLRILDGMLLVYDSTTSGPARRDRLDAQHMKLTGINLALEARIREEEKHLTINRGSLQNAFGDVGLRNLSGDVTLRRTGVEVTGLSIQTPRSGLILSAAVDSLDVLGTFDTDRLPDLPLAVSLSAPEVDMRDLQYFLPPLDMLGGIPTLKLSARGTLTELEIQNLELEAGESYLSFSGWLQNILAGTDMHIDVRSDDSRIHGADVPRLIPGIEIMDLSGMGTAEFSLLRFHGRPLDFTAEMDMESDAGAVAGTMALDLTGEDLVYDGMIRTRNADLQRVLGDPGMSSSLTLQAAIRGSGTRIGRIVAEMNLKVDSSRFRRYSIQDLDLQVDVRRDSLTLDLDARLGGSSMVMDGGMSFRPDSITGFRLQSDASSLDLSRALGDDAWASDLTFVMTAQGDGVDLATSSGSVEIAFEPSRLRDITIEQDTFRLVLQQSVAGEGEYLLLASKYADARIDGRFDFPRFFDYLALQTDSLSRALNAFTLAPDSAALALAEAAERAGASPDAMQDRQPAASRRDGGVPQPSFADTAIFMDVDYSIKLKNPERIARYFDASTFLVRGNYRGSIRGGMAGFGVNGELHVSDFYYVDSVRTWLAAGVRFTYDIRDLQLRDPLEHLRMDARFTAADLNIDGLRLSRTDVQLSYADLRPELRVRSMFDTLMQVDVQAYAAYEDYGVDIRLPRVDLRYMREPWTNDREIAFRIDSTGITVERFVLAHDAMRITLSGHRTLEGANDFTLYGDSLDVGMLEYLATGSVESRDGDSFRGVASLQADISGTDAAPLMAADLYIDSLGYRRMDFGEMVVEARYYSGKLELYSELAYLAPSGKEENVFFLSGTLPMHIGFGDAAEDDVLTREEAEQAANLRMQMKAFPLALIEDFLGLFSPLDGTADADVTLSGTREQPTFNGFLAVQNARGRFVFNNMEYLLGMRIEATGQDIRIVEATVKNTPSDWSAGRLNASGTISTEAFSISTFDLSVNGQLKVLKPASRSAMRALYGDLYISTGDESLTWDGRLDRSKLIGDIIIEEGNLFMPLQQTAVSASEYADITYVVVDDTTRQVTSSLAAGRFGRMRQSEEESVEPRMPERSVLEGLTYDLTLSTRGTLRVEIPLTPLQEELNAVLQFEDLNVNNWGGGGMKFVGEVVLGSDSYYIFFGKRMTATGSLRFTRDPMNPDLDLKAVYSDFYIDPRTEVRRRVFVIIDITGTKNQPELAWDMRWDSEEGEPVTAAGDIESDAFSFLLFGVFAKDFTTAGGDRSSLVEKTPELVNALGSSLASSVATQFLARAGLNEFIKRVELAALGTQESRIKVTGSLGRAVIIYDGKINNLGSSNVTAEFPLSRILGIPWTNIIMQVSRKTIDERYESATQTQDISIWELKLLERFSF